MSPRKTSKSKARPGSLLSPEAMGGINALKGFDFQTRFAACHVPVWLLQSAFCAATNGVLGPLFAMEDPGGLRVLTWSSCAWLNFPCSTNTLRASSANSFQSGHPASFDAPAPTNGISFVNCAASRSPGGTSGVGGIVSVIDMVGLASPNPGQADDDHQHRHHHHHDHHRSDACNTSRAARAPDFLPCRKLPWPDRIPREVALVKTQQFVLGDLTKRCPVALFEMRRRP